MCVSNISNANKINIDYWIIYNLITNILYSMYVSCHKKKPSFLSELWWQYLGLKGPNLQNSESSIMQFGNQHTLSFKTVYDATCYPSSMGACHFWWPLLQHYKSLPVLSTSQVYTLSPFPLNLSLLPGTFSPLASSVFVLHDTLPCKATRSITKYFTFSNLR